jgi:hypothetical protein
MRSEYRPAHETARSAVNVAAPARVDTLFEAMLSSVYRRAVVKRGTRRSQVARECEGDLTEVDDSRLRDPQGA